MPLIQIILSLLLFSSLLFLVWALFRYPVDLEPEEERQFARAVGMDTSRPLFDHPVLGRPMALALTLARRLSLPALRAKARRDLNASGNPGGHTVTEYIALAFASAAGLGLFYSLIDLLLLEHFDVLFATVAVGVGFVAPFWSLHNAAQNRLLRITKKLPYTMDLVGLMMAAGSSFNEAIETLIRDEPEDDLNQELRIALQEIQFGASRAEALTAMAGRVPIDSMRSMVGAINQAESLGTPLSTIFKAQAQMLRMHRSVRAEKLSASASLRILVPSMLILLAVVAVVFAPLIIRMLRGDLQMF